MLRGCVGGDGRTVLMVSDLYSVVVGTERRIEREVLSGMRTMCGFEGRVEM